MSEPDPPAGHNRCELIAAASLLLGDDAPPAGSGLSDYIVALARSQEATGPRSLSSAQEAHLRELADLECEATRRLDALRAVARAGVGLAEHSSAGEILAAAPAALGEIGDIRRVVLGQVRNGRLVVQRCFVRDDPQAALELEAALVAKTIELRHPLVETEVMRRQRPVLVDAINEPRLIHPHLFATMQWDRFVVAPVVVAGTVIALLYADHASSEPIDHEGQTLVVRFTSELAKAYETAQLRRALRAERDAARRFASWLDYRSRELTTDGDERASRASPGLSTAAESVTHASVPGKPILFSGVLTSRELEVLELLSSGHSNRGIAAELVLSPATVKSHVSRILSKLEVANRTEAVALYLARQESLRSPD